MFRNKKTEKMTETDQAELPKKLVLEKPAEARTVHPDLIPPVRPNQSIIEEHVLDPIFGCCIRVSDLFYVASRAKVVYARYSDLTEP